MMRGQTTLLGARVIVNDVQKMNVATAARTKTSLRAASAFAHSVLSGMVEPIRNCPPTETPACVSAYEHFARAYKAAKGDR